MVTLAGSAIPNLLHGPPRRDRLFPQGKRLSLEIATGLVLVYFPLVWGVFHFSSQHNTTDRASPVSKQEQNPALFPGVR